MQWSLTGTTGSLWSQGSTRHLLPPTPHLKVPPATLPPTLHIVSHPQEAESGTQVTPHHGYHNLYIPNGHSRGHGGSTMSSQSHQSTGSARSPDATSDHLHLSSPRPTHYSNHTRNHLHLRTGKSSRQLICTPRCTDTQLNLMATHIATDSLGQGHNSREISSLQN